MTEDKTLLEAKTTPHATPNQILGTWISLGAGLGIMLGQLWLHQFMWGLLPRPELPDAAG